jgi:4-hydroxy-2-oxoheptanedioate aldolase
LHCYVVLSNNTQMKNRNSIKQRLKSGERLNACLIGILNPVVAEIIAISGYDIALIDLEHSPGSYNDALAVMQSISGHGCSAIIRTPSSDIVDIKKALDIGPMGIMIPNVASAAEARKVVSACRYGPEGTRGAAPVVIRASGYGRDVPAYLNFMAKDFLVIAQIESKQAVYEIDEIASIEGIDMLFIGPLDLSAAYGSLGNFNSPEFTGACAQIERATLASGKLLGNLSYPERSAKQLYQSGYNLVMSGLDIQLLKQAAESDVANARDAASSSC